MTVTEAAETTISTAIERGIVDERLHAAALAAVRMLAAKADESVYSEKVDNVTLPTLLKYLDALGIVGATVREAAKPEAAKTMTLVDGGSRWARRKASGG